MEKAVRNLFLLMLKMQIHTYILYCLSHICVTARTNNHSHTKLIRKKIAFSLFVQSIRAGSRSSREKKICILYVNKLKTDGSRQRNINDIGWVDFVISVCGFFLFSLSCCLLYRIRRHAFVYTLHTT